MSSVAIKSYDLESMNRGKELTRLEMQASVVVDLEVQMLLQQGIARDATVLDVGCGPGFLSRRIAALVPAGEVVGLDADPAMVEQADRWCARMENARFIRGSAEHLPFLARAFDLSYARFLLQHVPEPLEVLKEMARVTRTGGRVMVVDTDDGALVVHPTPHGLPRLLRASKDSQAVLGGDRHIGRKLKGLMMAAGLKNVRVQLVPFTSDMVGIPTFVDIVLGFKRQVIDPDRMSADEVNQVVAELRNLERTPGAFMQAFGYMATGTAP